MNTKNRCWLCSRGYGIDNGSLNPGEMKPNMFGDLECIYCSARLDFTAFILDKPEIIRLVSEAEKLPSVDGVKIGIHFVESEQE